MVEQEYYFDAPVEEVFRALTEPEELVKWFLASARIELKKGADYTFTWPGGANHTGKVKRFATNRYVVLTWPDVVKGKMYATEVSFGLSRKGKGTLLRLKHYGFQKGDDWLWLFGAIQSGWAYFLTNLKSVLSQRSDLRSEYDNP